MFDDRIIRVDYIILPAISGSTHPAAKVDVQGRAACEQEREQDKKTDQHHRQQSNACCSHGQYSDQDGKKSSGTSVGLRSCPKSCVVQDGSSSCGSARRRKAREVSDIASSHRSPEGPGPLSYANVGGEWSGCKAKETTPIQSCQAAASHPWVV